ncbi:Hsp70 family protein [Nocardia aurea]|uniref:Hsp70 family protein n=1 Tax=Nocardia aurea TaxID=2144174 RepID=UPI0033B69A94
MTERLALGITVGALNSVAVATSGTVDDVDVGPAYGGTVLTHPSVLRLGADSAPVFGTTAGPSSRHSNDIVFEGFLDRVGDPVDLLAEDGSTHSAAALVATAVRCLVDETATATGQAPEAVIVCHPAWWSRHTVDVQRGALVAADLPEVTLIPEPTAAMSWLEAAHERLDDGAVVVYDLGATGLTISVMRTGAHAGPLATPLRTTDVAGAEFDLLVMRYILANARQGNEFDPFDPVIERELSGLRTDCRKAKEALSINTATVVPVGLDPTVPGGQQIRLVRDELEELLRAPLLVSLDLIRDAVHRAGLGIGDIGRVLLTGGGSSIPLVAELISTEFGLPVVAAPDPAQTSARGAAALATDLLAAEVATTPHGFVADTPTDALPAVITAARPATDLQADALPVAPPATGMTTRRRVAIVAGAALVMGLIGAGTLAIGTGLPGSPNQPASTQQQVTPGEQASANTTPSADGTAPAQPAASPGTPGAPQAGNPTGGAGSPTGASPGSTVGVVNGQGTPAQAGTGEPAPAGGPATAATPENGTPQQAQAPQPAPQQQPAPQPQPQPQPAPQPQPQPTQIPLPAPTVPKPQVPSLPTGVLENTIDGVGEGVGGAVGTILDAPGEILGGNGG